MLTGAVGTVAVGPGGSKIPPASSCSGTGSFSCAGANPEGTAGVTAGTAGVGVAVAGFLPGWYLQPLISVCSLSLPPNLHLGQAHNISVNNCCVGAASMVSLTNATPGASLSNVLVVLTTISANSFPDVR